MYESIKGLRPHFFSLREIENNVSLDVKFPLGWKYDNIVAQYKLVKTKVQDKNDKFHLVSLVSSANQEGFDIVVACAMEIITVNREEEEKRKLLMEKQRLLQEEFQKKIKELEETFKREPLEKLKELTLTDNYGQEDITGSGVVGEGEDEGQERD